MSTDIEQLREKLEEILLDPGLHSGYMNGIEQSYPGLRVRLTSEILKSNLNMKGILNDLVDLITKREKAAYDLGSSFSLLGNVKQIANELARVRKIYDSLEDGMLVYGADNMGRNWKGIRNVLTDRIEELTGNREYDE